MPAQQGKTRERMMDVAELLFHNRGYAGVTVEDITAALGMKKPNLYNHFRDKTDLYVAVRLRRLSRLGTDVSDALSRDAAFPDRFRALLEALLRHPYFLSSLLNRDAEAFLPQETRDMLFARSFGAVYEPVTGLIGQAIEIGCLALPPGDADFAYEALVALAAHFGALDRPDAGDEERMARAEQIARLCLAA